MSSLLDSSSCRQSKEEDRTSSTRSSECGLSEDPSGNNRRFNSISTAHSSSQSGDGGASVFSKPSDASVDEYASAATRTMDLFQEDYLRSSEGATQRLQTGPTKNKDSDHLEESSPASPLFSRKKRADSIEALQKASSILEKSDQKIPHQKDQHKEESEKSSGQNDPPCPPAVAHDSTIISMEMVPPSPPGLFGMSPSPRWTPGPAGARRKMVPITRVPSKRGLVNANSNRSLVSATSTITSINEEEHYDDHHSYFTETDLEDDLEDDCEYDTMSNITEESTLGDDNRVIAIGIIAPPAPSAPAKLDIQGRNKSISSMVSRDSPAAQPTRQKSDRALNEEAVSELVACDLAKQEHDLKMKTKQAGAAAGRRLSAPTSLLLSPNAGTRNSVTPTITKNKTRMSMPTIEQSDLEASMSSLGNAAVVPPALEPVLASTLKGQQQQLDSTNPSTASVVGSVATASRPSLRARKSGRLGNFVASSSQNSVGSSNHSVESDRQAKLRAIRGSMRRVESMDSGNLSQGSQESFKVTARKPPARTARLEGQGSSDVDRMRGGPSSSSQVSSNPTEESDRRAKLQAARSALSRTGTSGSSGSRGEDNKDKFVVTPRKPPLRPPSTPAPTPEAPSLEREMSMTSVSSGIDLEPEIRDSIIARSAAQAQRRRSEREANGMAVATGAPGVARVPSTVSSRTNATSGSEEFSIGTDDDSRKLPSRAALQRVPRPSDEKAAFRRNPSAVSAQTGSLVDDSSSVTPRSSRPSDEKAAYRHNPSANMQSRSASTSSSVSAAASRILESRPSREFVARSESPVRDLHEPGAITTVDVNRDAEELQAVEDDLEAQAGVPVVLPGAFAIDGLDGNEDAGYDSGFENGSISTRSDEEGALQPSIQVADPASSTPLEAELYENSRERDAIDAAEVVLTNGDEDEIENEKDKKRIRLIQIVSIVFGIVIVIIIILSTTLTTVLKTTSEKQGPPELKGWKQLGDSIIGPTEEDNSRFGYEVCMAGDGHRMAVGVPGRDTDVTMIAVGAVFVMDFNGTDWNNVWSVDGPGQNAEAGKAIGMSRDGNRLAIGAPGWEGGQVEVYEVGTTGSWDIVGEPIANPSELGGDFGDDLSISGDGSIIAVGNKLAQGEDGASDIGSVFVYQFKNSTWSLMGSPIEGEDSGDFFGWSVDLSSDGKRVVATAPGRNDFTGAAYCFDFDGSDWKQSGPTINGEFSRENFGTSVALSDDGSVMSVGATGFSPIDVGVGVGRVRSFSFDSFTKKWEQMGGALTGVDKFDSFGNSVALSSYGDTLAIGGPENDRLGDNSGHVQVYRFSGLEWVKVGSDLGQYDLGEAEGGEFGFSVALSSDGTRVVGGAPFYNFNGFVSDVGQVLAFEVDQDASE